MQNVIQRELTINASQQRIYNAIATPGQVVKWFPDKVEGKYQVGEQAVFTFDGHGESSVYIQTATPFSYFAYRWVPGGTHFVGDLLTVATTLVEFHIEEIAPGRCKVTLTETGFAGLPSDIATTSFKENSGGWDFMLARLTQYFSGEAK